MAGVATSSCPSALTDTLHAAFGPSGSPELPSSTPQSLFAPRPPGATVVYKKRRLAVVGASGDAAVPGHAPAEPAERAPRVVRVSAVPASAPQPEAVAAAPEPALVAVPRRRRRRDALRAPGAVHHMVFERPASLPVEDDGGSVETGAHWTPQYPRLLEALSAVTATLAQVAQLRRFAAELQLLLPPVMTTCTDAARTAPAAASSASTATDTASPPGAPPAAPGARASRRRR